MNTHTVTLTLTIRAASACDAVQIGIGAAEHLQDTFNDDKSISALVGVEAGAVALPRRKLAAVLAVLLKCEAPRPVKARALAAVDTLRTALGGAP